MSCNMPNGASRPQPSEFRRELRAFLAEAHARELGAAEVRAALDALYRKHCDEGERPATIDLDCPPEAEAPRVAWKPRKRGRTDPQGTPALA
jgi:hypothetical protein